MPETLKADFPPENSASAGTRLILCSHLTLPGIPMVYFGEEQEHYVLENLANDYVFGTCINDQH